MQGVFKTGRGMNNDVLMWLVPLSYSPYVYAKVGEKHVSVPVNLSYIFFNLKNSASETLERNSEQKSENTGIATEISIESYHIIDLEC